MIVVEDVVAVAVLGWLKTGLVRVNTRASPLSTVVDTRIVAVVVVVQVKRARFVSLYMLKVSGIPCVVLPLGLSPLCGKRKQWASVPSGIVAPQQSPTMNSESLKLDIAYKPWEHLASFVYALPTSGSVR